MIVEDPTSKEVPVPNRPPVALAQSGAITNHQTLEITLTGSDEDGDDLRFEVVKPPVLGTLTGTPPQLVYTPTPGLSGTEMILFRATDGLHESDPAAISILVSHVNTVPVAHSQNLVVPDNGIAEFRLSASDPDPATTLVYTLVEGPSHGTISGTPPQLIYRPQLPYHPTDTLKFRVSDGISDSNISVVTLSVPALESAFPDPIPDSLDFALPAGLQVSIDLPLTDSDVAPPVNLANASHSPTVVGTPQIQTTIKRPGKSYAAFTPGLANGATSGRFSFGEADYWTSLENRSFAMQAWVYLPAANLAGTFTWVGNTIQGLNTIFGSGGVNGEGPRFGVVPVGGQPRLTMLGQAILTGPAAVVSTKAFPLDAWVHVAVTYDHERTSTVLYMNGIPVGSSDSVTYQATGLVRQYNLGSAEYNGPWSMAWRGYISNFKLYTPAPTLTTNLRAFYDLDGLADNTGNYPLTNQGSVSFVPGKIGQAAQFSGSNYLYNNSLSLGGAREATWSAWVQTPAPISHQTNFLGVWGIGHPTATQFVMLLSNGDYYDALQTPDDAVGDRGMYGFATPAPQIADGQWHYMVSVFTGRELQTYRNGQLASSVTFDPTTIADVGSSYFGIGRTEQSHAGNTPYTGLIDGVGIWERALSSAEVLHLYNGGSGRSVALP